MARTGMRSKTAKCRSRAGTCDGRVANQAFQASNDGGGRCPRSLCRGHLRSKNDGGPRPCETGLWGAARGEAQRTGTAFAKRLVTCRYGRGKFSACDGTATAVSQCRL